MISLKDITFLLCFTTEVGFRPYNCLADEPTKTSPSLIPTYAGVVRSPASLATTSRRPSLEKRRYNQQLENVLVN